MVLILKSFSALLKSFLFPFSFLGRTGYHGVIIALDLDGVTGLDYTSWS